MQTQKIRLVNCPVCRKPTAFSQDNQYRPFCSERCESIDLGAWASEEYKVPEMKQPQDTSD